MTKRANFSPYQPTSHSPLSRIAPGVDTQPTFSLVGLGGSCSSGVSISGVEIDVIRTSAG